MTDIIRWFAMLTLLAALPPSADGRQRSELRVESAWNTGMTGWVCVTHDLDIRCGWGLRIDFSTPIEHFETWRAKVKKIKPHKGGTRVKASNYHYNKEQPSETCHKFMVSFNGQQPAVKARYYSVKKCEDDHDDDIDDNDDDTQNPTPPLTDPDVTDYRVETKEVWPGGYKGDMCLYHTADVTCGYDAEIVFRGPVNTLEIWTMQMVDIIRGDGEVRFRLRNLDWSERQEDNPTCHEFIYRHEGLPKPTYVAGHYLRVCNDNGNNYDPNQGGTTPPPTLEPSTAAPTTQPPTTQPPLTMQPTSQQPTSQQPTSQPPTSQQPTSQQPTSQQPTSQQPTSQQPTSQEPTSQQPTSQQPTSQQPTTKPPSLTTQPQETTTEASTGLFNYRDSLRKSMLFYFAQRSGSIDDDIIPWRHDSGMGDGGDVGRDLTGGWYDAGDHVKFGFPMAWSTTTLLWGFLEWKTAYDNIAKTDLMYTLVKHPLDYFLKCWDNDNQIFYGQVGNGDTDHAWWGRPEDMTMYRPTYRLDGQNGGSDLAGETAAALAAGSMSFRSKDAEYADKLLTAARQLYDFADTHRRRYHLSIHNAGKFYMSHSGYWDELCWGAAWLYKATGDNSYYEKAFAAMTNMDQSPGEYSWDSKSIGCYMLMYEESSGQEKQVYKGKVEQFMTRWLDGQGVTYSPCGLAFLRSWGSLRYAANAALIGLMAAENGIMPNRSRRFAESQINYMLGSCTGYSYQVGYGDHYPQQPHHKAATCPLPPAPCDWGTYSSNSPNAHVLTGALVGGPDVNDNYQDRRSEYVHTEVATDYNAGFQSSLAGLISLDMRGMLRR